MNTVRAYLYGASVFVLLSMNTVIMNILMSMNTVSINTLPNILLYEYRDYEHTTKYEQNNEYTTEYGYSAYEHTADHTTACIQ